MVGYWRNVSSASGGTTYEIHRQEHRGGCRLQHRHGHPRLARREPRAGGGGAAAVVSDRGALSDLRGHLFRHQPGRGRALCQSGEEVKAVPRRGEHTVLF